MPHGGDAVSDAPARIAPPVIDRPAIPAAYGVGNASEHVSWAHVEDRLTADRVYWVATVGATGRPTIRPIDGVYLDGALYVGGSPETRWIRDLAGNPHVAVHLASVDDVVILEGEARRLETMDRDLAERLAAASNAKFPEYDQTPEVYMRRGAIEIRPTKVVSWSDITRNPTRFRFAR
jgi:nitroimidazol reductase NimA-like FMN-containing flavoprotein (pyridoxamine 5'-phosphate oxidase superfamily)